jgi:hypothetical protein
MHAHFVFVKETPQNRLRRDVGVQELDVFERVHERARTRRQSSDSRHLSPIFAPWHRPCTIIAPGAPAMPSPER